MKGYFVPDFLGEFAHTWLPIFAYDNNKQDDLTDKEKIYERDDPSSFIKTKFEEFKASVQINKDKTWILSSEHLHARLNDVEIRRLKTLLYPLFNEIKVIVYLRNPIEATVSLWSTAVRAGKPIKKYLTQDLNGIIFVTIREQFKYGKKIFKKKSYQNFIVKDHF